MPYPVHTPMFHVHLPVPAEQARPAHDRLCKTTGVQLLLKIRSNPDPGRCSFEIVVGENALEITAQEVAMLIRELIADADNGRQARR